ncbi:Rad4-domain-containing protein [Durotheca rogersii]|uniref:Rad4-domain-containing protein n=1 Tax=Durotheca rogersii TaxID=419775 RepID=UPI00221E8C44|nr:Rad4-domain-containing protein [Durotheca rogersii]KAI5866249.1 Rad4-domain-containing protein [Durotheca rogersii]
MAGRKRAAARNHAGNATASGPSRATRSRTTRSNIPDIYREMLVEARPNTASPERPLKRRRPGQRNDRSPKEPSSPKIMAGRENDEDEDDGLQFEDVPLPAATIQTVYMDSEEEDEDDDDVQFEDVDLSATPQTLDPAGDNSQDLELDLSTRATAARKTADKRKPMNKAEKDRRVEIHKTHLLCLLAHVARRNQWCNDAAVQGSLAALLTKKMVDYLNPSESLPQFGRAQSLKDGLQQAGTMFKTKFQITERGIRRALWAEREEHLRNYKLPDDIETPMERATFREAAKSLRGSRDVGAQLYCALLRAAGVEARLVCSLQPLAFGPGGPPLGKPPRAKGKLSLEEQYARMPKYDSTFESPNVTSSPIRRRLGHPNATAYQVPVMPAAASSSRPTPPVSKRIRESPHPIYWVEILDEAHQKWQPADPLVTDSFWKPQKFEPPASDKENCMAYVVAFEADGTAKDVTRRYAKAYNAKTRKMRIESAEATGERWWRRALRAYYRGYVTDLDQIENNELTAIEAREPMPRNLADFKDHPIYALERHLRRNEVLVPGASSSGTVGPGSTGPLERVYRRRDVRIARSREKWYRMGREVLANEIPVKFLPKRTRKTDLFGDDAIDDNEETVGTPIYTTDQTILFRHPPVVDGRVPKNRFGNLDLYVPSMVPEGGAYVADELATRAAFILGIDYAPALTGFHFSGRHGTAVLYGAVVAAEHEEAVRAVVAGLRDREAEREREQRSREALKTWRLFLRSLRVRQRIWADVDSNDEAAAEELDQATNAEDEDGAQSGVEGDEAGGGFVVDDDDYAGGFFVE